jgi:gas vesicle protein
VVSGVIGGVVGGVAGNMLSPDQVKVVRRSSLKSPIACPEIPQVRQEITQRTDRQHTQAMVRATVGSILSLVHL